jgi:hypothetical protein
MTFPASAINGQVTVVNGITYIFSASTTSWTRVPTIISNIGNLNSQSSLTVGGNIGVNIATPRASLDLGNTTGMMLLPTGGSSQRPNTAECGSIRFNTCIGALEWYGGNSATIGTSTYYPGWYPFSSSDTGGYLLNYVLVGGGGGSSGGVSSVNYGAGGAGGILMSGTTIAVTCKSYTITIGGAGSAVNQGTPGPGGVTTGVSVTAPGGCVTAYTGTTGGRNALYVGGSPSGTDGAGGGAGAGGPGRACNVGGIGVCTSITGSVLTFGGGGGGRSNSGTAAGGTGGGGAGGSAGSTNTGGGGGGGCATSGGTAGGSGVAYFSYANPTQRATGGCTITSYCKAGTKYWVHTFKSSGTYKA